jgi:hypothetical protein
VGKHSQEPRIILKCHYSEDEYKRERDQKIATVLAVVLALVPWGFTMPVTYKWSLWGISLAFVLYLVLNTIPSLANLSTPQRVAVGVAVFDAGVRAFIFTENTLRGEMRAEILRRALPQMRNLVRDNPPPFIATLTVDGNTHIHFDLRFHKQVLRREKSSERKRHKPKARRKTVSR